MLAYTRSSVPIGMAALASLLLAADPAGAIESVQGNKLLVKALVGDACTVTSASLDFPPYNSATGVTATGEILIDCVTETEIGVKLDGGLHGSNGDGQRTLKNTASDSTLIYALRKDLANNAWLPTDVVTETITDGSIPVYGVIAGSQTPGDSGLYTDEVTITLVFQ